MAVIETRNPDGRITVHIDVGLTLSGMFIALDDGGGVTFIHRDAWASVVKIVENLFEEKKAQAKQWMETHPDEDD